MALAFQRAAHRPELGLGLGELDSGWDPATMPQPANSLARLPTISPQRSAMPHSPLPRASTQPTGPEYRPRSMPSSSRISSIAASVGVPQIAAVGCSEAASASAEASLASTPDTDVARCW